MNNPFDSARALLSHANTNIQTLSDLLSNVQFELNVLPTRIHSNKTKADTGLEIKRRPDMREALIAFDIVSALRSALDHSTYASALLVKGAIPKSYKFPFARQKSQIYGRTREQSKDLHQKIISLIMSFEPWEDGNIYLYGLNELRNTTIHRVLSPTGVMIRTEKIDDAECDEPVWIESKSHLVMKNVNVTDNGDGTSTVASSHLWDLKLAIGADGLLFKKEPIATFNAISGVVKSILVGIEAETRRLL